MRFRDERGDAPAGDGEERSRILICDDSAVIRSFARTLLEPTYDCLDVASAERALEAVPTFGPDLIISDLVMEGISGFELCRRVRSEPATSDVPFILLTGEKGNDTRALGLEVGADDFLFKPIRPRELLARVASLLRLRAASRALKTRTRELEEANRALKEAHAALVRSEKLATVGTLAAGVAHEINNPLAFMKSGVVSMLGYLDDLDQVATATCGADSALVKAQRPIVSELRAIGAEISEGFVRIERIVRDLRDFSSTRREASEPVDLGAEVERAWKLASMRARGNVHFHFDCPEPIRVPAVRSQLGQVFLNVMLNAVQAVDGRHGEVRASVARESGAAVVRIADNGPGIPAGVLPRIFDPFFTTKSPGQGSGLGLSVSYGIVQAMGGNIEAASSPDEGALFTIRLPAER